MIYRRGAWGHRSDRFTFRPMFCLFIRKKQVLRKKQLHVRTATVVEDIDHVLITIPSCDDLGTGTKTKVIPNRQL